MTTKNKIGGVMTALATPFKDGALDKKSFTRLLKRQLDEGVQGFVINGTTGESPTLKLNEVRELFDIAKGECGGQVPLIVGSGTNSTAHTIEVSREVCKWQPDALLTVVPYYNRPSQRGLLEHFKQVAKNVSAPVLLYDVPGRTVAGLAPDTVGELSRVANIIGLKDATGNMQAHEKIKAASRAGFILLSGDDATAVDYCSRGGHGVISVSSHIIAPEMRKHIAQGTAGLNEYATKYQELMKYLFIEANPVPVKAALHWMGIFDSMEMRLPLVPLDEKFHKDFKACLKNLGKI
jgi:4-hydroxy-tetrahydrodipicolinate synthase